MVDGSLITTETPLVDVDASTAVTRARMPYTSAGDWNAQPREPYHMRRSPQVLQCNLRPEGLRTV